MKIRRFPFYELTDFISDNIDCVMNRNREPKDKESSNTHSNWSRKSMKSNIYYFRSWQLINIIFAIIKATIFLDQVLKHFSEKIYIMLNLVTNIGRTDLNNEKRKIRKSKVGLLL